MANPNYPSPPANYQDKNHKPDPTMCMFCGSRSISIYEAINPLFCVIL